MLVAAVCLAASAVAAPELRAEVVVVRRDGVRVVGDGLSPQTDAGRLAIRRERPGIVLTRFVDWADVASVRIDGETVPPESLRPRQTRSPVDLVEPTEQPVSFESTEATRGDARSAIPSRAGSRRSSAPVLPPVEEPLAVRPSPVAPCALPPSTPLLGNGEWIAPPLATRGVVVGVWDDPLSAYADILGSAYPAGVPVAEAGFALGVMRSARLQQVLGGPIVWPPPPPPPVLPPIVPFPGEFDAVPPPGIVPFP